jgi:CHAT domain-containing protein/Tfp pilus assembly protein PilF
MSYRQKTHKFFLPESFLIIILLSLAVFGQNKPNDEMCRLLDVQPIERQMSGAETHCYRIDLQKDQFLQVKVEQKGIDVALKFYDSNQKLISEIDSPNGVQGFEVLSLVASETGVYKLEISSSEADAPKGNYSIFRDALRTATEQDRQKFEAQQAFAQGKNSSSSPPDALKLFQNAAELFQSINDKKGAADSFTEVGFTAISLGNGSLALTSFEKALIFYRDISDQREAAKTIKYIGYIYGLSGNSAKALEKYEEAVPLFHSSDTEDKADTLDAIGIIYFKMTDLSKSLENYQQALSLFNKIGNFEREIGTLSNIGVVYSELGQKQKSLETFTQLLEIVRKNNLKQAEVAVLSNLGRAFDDLGNKDKALENFNLALSIVENKKGKAAILLNIGKVYFDSGDNPKALENYIQSLKLFEEADDKYGESTAANAIGVYYSKSGEKQKAVEYYNRALKLQKFFGFQLAEGLSFGNLMRVWQSFSNRRLAIFYGKQSINVLQKIRANIETFDGESQRSFTKKVESIYRNLAELLIDEGRIAEAQEVLSLLKGEEFYQYTRRSSDAVANSVGQLELNVEETDAAQKYKKVDDANFIKVLQELTIKFSQPSSEKTAGLSNSQTKLWQKKLAEFGQGTVLLTTLVAGNRYYVIITTPTTQTARKVDLKQTDLNEKIGNLREILANPRTKTIPATQELYQILVKPVEADLARMNAKTLLWSLDGALRYVPFAALYDGEKYLVEKYTNAVVTLAQPPQNVSVSPTTWRALGAGVSTGNGELKPLPNVPLALKTIVRDETTKDQTEETGIFAGKRLLDKDFSRLNLTNALKQKFQLVHFATHFVFNPGKDVDSFLLLGGGDKLNLAELRTNKLFDLTGVDLLTLSACETARTELDANGVEIESFGVIAQRRGAKTVLATLWSISDNAAPKLMEEFYRQYQAGNGTVSKAEALRQAQIALLKKSKTDQNFAHPAYWSAYIVLGEWR